MRLIDADALYEQTAEWEATALHMVEKTMNYEDKTEWRRWSEILNERTSFKYDVADAPTIEAEPVKHGRWMEENRRPRSIMFYCSECHRTAYSPQGAKGTPKRCRYSYCPNCGAKMDEEVTNV